MDIQEALRVLKLAGIKVSVNKIILKKREIKRINEILSLEGRCIVTHKGKKAMVHTFKGYKARQKAGSDTAAGKLDKKPEA